MSDNLCELSCTPCRGGIPALTLPEAEAFLLRTPGWSLLEAGRRLVRRYPFPDFQTALDFVNRVGALAEREGHHPEMTLTWGAVTVAWWTHKIDGLHENDFIMAAKTDALR